MPFSPTCTACGNFIPQSSHYMIVIKRIITIVFLVIFSAIAVAHETRLRYVESTQSARDEVYETMLGSIQSLTAAVQQMNRSYDDQNHIMQSLSDSQREILKNQTLINAYVRATKGGGTDGGQSNDSEK